MTPISTGDLIPEKQLYQKGGGGGKGRRRKKKTKDTFSNG